MTETGSALAVTPSGAALGAEIQGVDIARGVTAADVERIRAALARHLVLVFRAQCIDDAMLLGFSRRFGELDPPGPNPYGEPFHREFPELNVISNIVEDGKPRGNLGDGEAVWHADMTYIERPPKGAVLYALELPPSGGDTYFANMYAAYAELPQTLKRRIEGRVAIHDAAHNSAGMLRRGYTEVSDVRETPGAHQPLVWTHPIDGRRALFLGRRPHSYIVGLDVAESEALLDALWEHATAPRFVMRHEWQLGDVLMWDNLAVLHRRDAFDPSSRRRLHRAQLRGEETIR